MFDEKIEAATMNQPEVAAGQEVVVGRVAVLADRIPRQAQQGEEIQADDRPVQCAHEVTSLKVFRCRNTPDSNEVGP